MSDSDIIPGTPPWSPLDGRQLDSGRISESFSNSRSRVQRVSSEPLGTLQRPSIFSSHAISSSQSICSRQNSRSSPRKLIAGSSTADHVVWLPGSSVKRRRLSGSAPLGKSPGSVFLHVTASELSKHAPIDRSPPKESKGRTALADQDGNSATSVTASPSTQASPLGHLPPQPAGCSLSQLDEAPPYMTAPAAIDRLRSPTPQKSPMPAERRPPPAENEALSERLQTLETADLPQVLQSDSGQILPSDTDALPPRRNLRTRKPGQMNPYTLEMALYRQRLERNDWQDAVVFDRHFRRQIREEIERRIAADHDDPDRPSRPSSSPERRRRRHSRKLDSVERPSSPEETENRRAPSASSVHSRNNAAASTRRPTSTRSVIAAIQSSGSDSESPAVAGAMTPGSKQRRMDIARARLRLPSLSESDTSSAGPTQVAPGRRRRILSSSTSDSDSSHGDPGANNAEGPLSPTSSQNSGAEYSSLFKKLKRMMPIHMARKYIADLKNMKKGKAYHSDGHVSATPEPSSDSSSEAEGQGDDPSATIRSIQSTPATSPVTSQLRPGEARKRVRNGTSAEKGRLVLSGDSESESDVASSCSSGSDAEPEPADENAVSSAGEAQEERGFNTDLSWWTTGAIRTQTNARHQDHVDRSLRRSEPFLSSKPGRAVKGQRPLRWEARSGHSRPRPTRETPDSARSERVSSRRRHKKRRSGPAPTRGGLRLPGQPRFGDNPPVVQIRTRRRLDLRDDDTIFGLGLVENDGRDTHDMAALADQVGEEFVDHGGMRRSASLSRTSAAGSMAAPTSSPRVRLESGPGIDPQPHHAALEQLTTAHSAQRGLSDAPPKEAAPGLRTHIPTDTSRRKGPPRQSSHGEPSSAQLEANAWADISHIRVDFDIAPIAVGTAFAAHTYIGSGRLHELIHLGDERIHFGGNNAHLRHYLQPLDLTLPSVVTMDAVGDVLPRLFDAIFLAVQSAEGTEANQSVGIQQAIDDALRFLHCILNVWVEDGGIHRCRYAIGIMDAQAVLLIQRLETDSANGGAHTMLKNNAILRLRWFTIELSWRLMACGRHNATGEGLGEGVADEETLISACADLMRRLLTRGVHRSVRCVQAAAVVSGDTVELVQSSNESPTPPKVDDLPAELWVRLVYLLDRVGGQQNSHGAVFWPLLESALEAWMIHSPTQSPVLLAEAVWYTTFALCALSQFSAANGTAGSTPHLKNGWTLVSRAFNSVTLRYEDGIENRMPNSALRRRDRYIHATILRCHRLNSQWGWSLSDCDIIVFKIFDIFNSHRLTDLPTDADHDFPLFLRQFDANLLMQEPSREPTAYLAFINLLARIARSMQEGSRDLSEGDRKVSRLCSRLCPVRVMPFTKESRPTSHERSSLYNHYTLVMLYLYFVPSAAPQRLRQMKGFLVFQTADMQSQITCLRAMVYTLAILGHHDYEIGSAASWLSGTAKGLLSAAEAATLAGVNEAPGEHFATVRRTKESVGLMVHCLRSIQHMIEHPSLRSDQDLSHSSYPDSRLLEGVCASELLESTVAVEHVEVGVEALRCIKSFLLRRNVVVSQVHGLAQPSLGVDLDRPSTEAQANASESQDSLMGAFDDEGFDFADPDLERLLAAEEEPATQQNANSSNRPHTSIAQLRAADYAFAETVGTPLSASLFRLLSNAYHPSRWSNKQSSRQSTFVELLTDCWAGCANVLVRNGLRDWHSYLNYGNECWKRLGDFAGRRDIGLRFLQNIVILDPTAYHDNQSEFLQVWFQAAAAREISIQALFTETLFRKVDPRMPWFENSMQRWPLDKVDSDCFRQQRTGLVLGAVENMRQEFESTKQSGSARRSAVFPCLSGLLSSMRTQLDELLVDSQAQKSPQSAAYLVFCKDVLAQLPEVAGPTLMRGIFREVERAGALLGGLPR